MMNEIEEGTEVSHTAFSGLDEQRYNEDYAEQSPQNYEEVNNENESISDNEATYATTGYSYITSNIKWFLIAIGSGAVFLGIGWGSGYEIGDAIFDNNESSVSSAMAADFTTSDNNGGKSGKGEGGAKSGKSTSVSYFFIHFVCT